MTYFFNYQLYRTWSREHSLEKKKKKKKKIKFFEEIDPQLQLNHQRSTCKKKSQGNIIVCWLFQIFLQIILLRETVSTTMMFLERHESNGSPHPMETDYFDIVASHARRWTSTVYVYNLHRLLTSIEKIKENGFTFKKRQADDICRLRRWSSASREYTCSRWIPAT